MRQRLLSRLQHAAAQIAAHHSCRTASATTTAIQESERLGYGVGEGWLGTVRRRRQQQQQQQCALLSEQSLRPDAAYSAKAPSAKIVASDGVACSVARGGGSGSGPAGIAKHMKAAGVVATPAHVQVLMDDKEGIGLASAATSGHGRLFHTSAAAGMERASESTSGPTVTASPQQQPQPPSAPAPAPAPAPKQYVPNGPLQFDTLSIMRALQAQGIEDHRAEAITRVFQGIVEAVHSRAEQCYVRKEELDKYELGHAASISVFKSDMKNTQHNQSMQVARELEALRSEVDKLRSDLQYEVDKITASHRLDINLEKGRMRDMLHQQEEKQLRAERRMEDAHIQTEKRMDNEVNSFRTQMEVNKNDLIKYSVASIVTLITLVLGVARLLM